MAESVKDASKYGPDDVDPAAALFFSTLIIVSGPNPFPPPFNPSSLPPLGETLAILLRLSIKMGQYLAV